MNFNNYGEAGYYKPDYFCGILPEIYESRHEFNIGSGSIDKKPVKKYGSKLKKEVTVRGPHIHSRPSIEGKMQGYR